MGLWHILRKLVNNMQEKGYNTVCRIVFAATKAPRKNVVFGKSFGHSPPPEHPSWENFPDPPLVLNQKTDLCSWGQCLRKCSACQLCRVKISKSVWKCLVWKFFRTKFPQKFSKKFLAKFSTQRFPRKNFLTKVFNQNFDTIQVDQNRGGGRGGHCKNYWCCEIKNLNLYFLPSSAMNAANFLNNKVFDGK